MNGKWCRQWQGRKGGDEQTDMRLGNGGILIPLGTTV